MLVVSVWLFYLKLIDCKLSTTGKHIFLANCLSFYVECSIQILERFPFHSPQIRCLKSLSCINPKKIKNIISIGPAANNFEQILDLHLNDLDREWRQLRDFDFEQDVSDFRKNVKDVTDSEGSTFFPLINTFFFHILILPHSSACVERIFSIINQNKTKIRNRLGINWYIVWYFILKKYFN